MEKYICENCGVEVPCDNWDLAIKREKQCSECSGSKRISIDTIRRINIRAGLLGKFVNENFKIVDKKPITKRKEIK
jgi:DNA-directed RNA polymerase subunit RPC12/RpoP